MPTTQRRHLVNPDRPPTSAAAADRWGRHWVASGARTVPPVQAAREARRLLVLLLALPGIEAHCLVRGTEGPDLGAICYRAGRYVLAFRRDGPRCPWWLGRELAGLADALEAAVERIDSAD